MRRRAGVGLWEGEGDGDGRKEMRPTSILNRQRKESSCGYHERSNELEASQKEAPYMKCKATLYCQAATE